MTTFQGVMNGNVYSSSNTVSRARASRHRRELGYVRMLLVVIGVLVIIVGMAAYSAKLQQRNNDLKQANANLQAEIDSLDSQIGDVTNIERIEDLAINKYGMVQPNADNYITVTEEAEISTDLASTIKKEAYN